MGLQLQEKERLHKVLHKARKEAQTREITTFIFARFFTTLLALLAPLFQTQTGHKGK